MNSKEQQTLALVFENGDKDVSFYTIWLYPSVFLKRGARVVFFRANHLGKTVCYCYLPEELASEGAGDGMQYQHDLDAVCDLALEALRNYGVDLPDEVMEMHVDVGELDPADLEDSAPEA